MKFLRLASFLLLGTLILGCNANKGTTISGTISDAGNMSIYFDRIGMDNTNEILLNTKANSDGNFEFVFPEVVNSGIYRIRAGAKSADIILNGTEKNVSLKGDLSSLGELTYEVTGAPLTEKYLSILQSMMNKELDSNKLTNMTVNELDPLIGLMVSTKVFQMRPEFMKVHKAVAQKLNEKYPNEKYTLSYKATVAQVERQYASQMASQKIKLGEVAPDIVLAGVDGKTRKLSDLKGKVVLLDFWASWCGPCRKANPKVVDVYNRYNAKGFEVFSVSLDGLDTRSKQRMKSEDQIKIQLDRSKERWLAAIEKDGLSWDHHVSDLKKWESEPASVYGVRSIPKTFLIDRDGKIAYIDPRYNLEEQVKKFL